jgi:hypothetical protein
MASCIMILSTALIVIIVLGALIFVHHHINNTVRCVCGKAAKLNKDINQYPFGGHDLYWYECEHCGRVGEKMITVERAYNAWKLKYQPSKTNTW